MNVHDQINMLEEEIEDLTQAIKERGLWVQGSRNQEILNPALGARRAAIETLRKLTSTIDSNPQDEDELEVFLGKG